VVVAPLPLHAAASPLRAAAAIRCTGARLHAHPGEAARGTPLAPRLRMRRALVACAGLLLASVAASPPAPVAWRRSAELPRADGASALAVDPGTGRVADGDATGVLVLGVGGRPARVLRRGPARDLAFLASGDLLAATEQGLYRIDAAGRPRRLTPAPGADRVPLRLAVAGDAVALATEDGAFLTRDTERWQRIRELPSGPVTAVALRAAGGELECFVLVRGELHTARVPLAASELGPIAAGREELALAFREDALDVVPGLAGADLALLFPTALALRERPAAPWRLVAPALPPGAQALRVAEGLGRLWLATDRGLLEAEAVEGPWRAASEPAGTQAVGALAAAGGSLFAAVGTALLVSDPARVAPPRGVLAELPVDPPIERVHRAALAYLELGPGRVAEMRRGVMQRGWLPTLALGGSVARDRDHGVDVDEAIVSGSLHRLVDRDAGANDDNDVGVTLTWDFADLVYHPEQIDISREAREIIELRDDVLDEITQLYFERRRVLVELASAPSPADALRLQLRAAELAAGIDAWTGGWFSRALRAPAPGETEDPTPR
jgi:hypothetical protein